MVSSKIKPQNTEESIVWYAILSVYPCYVLGALYLAGPVIAWLLFFVWIKRCHQGLNGETQTVALPAIQVIWIVSMFVMLLALIVGHLNYELPLTKIIKSSIGWAKGWALFAIFLLAGLLNIRFELIVRACCWLSVQTLILIPVFVLAWIVGAPQVLYVSPLSIIGGPGPEFFAMSLYEIDPGSGLPRWRLFTPWAPALGMLANFYLIFGFEEKSKILRRLTFLSTFMIVLMSQSRLALLCYLIIIGFHVQNRYFYGHRLVFLTAFASLLFGLFAPGIIDSLEQFYTAFREARIDSTRVREALARIAIERSITEAPIWGHGVIERGPHLVQYMPIGTHHTWYGLLFIKGVVGLFAFLTPLLASVVYLALMPVKQRVYRAAWLSVLCLFLYSFGENLEILAYLYWPALICLGIAHKQQFLFFKNSQEAS